MYCYSCGKEMLDDAKVCSKCGATIPLYYQAMIPQKSVVLAAILALIIPGVGHIYVGKVKQGILFLVVVFGFFVFMTAGMFVFVIGFGSGIPAFVASILIWLMDIFLLGIWISDSGRGKICQGV